jgi:polysaccharide biosynthesis/export protein
LGLQWLSSIWQGFNQFGMVCLEFACCCQGWGSCILPLPTISMIARHFLFAVAAFILAFTGCIPRGRLAYFQPNKTAKPDSLFSPPRTPYLLQPGDVLSIKFSGQDRAALAPFGQENEPTAAGLGTTQQAFIQGYSISDSGTLFLPVLGRLLVGGQTTEAAQLILQNAVSRYVNGAVARVRLISFKVSVLGEVRAPGLYYINNERCTLPEALGYAGDLTDAANRRSLRLIRNNQGKLTVYSINLTDRRLLASPLFYLQPNDVVYAEPIASKADRLNLPALGVVLTALTTILVSLNFFVR